MLQLSNQALAVTVNGSTQMLLEMYSYKDALIVAAGPTMMMDSMDLLTLTRIIPTPYSYDDIYVS